MAQTYQVNYIVDVNATNALTAINQFKTALTSMDKATRPLVDLQNKVRGLVETMSALNRGKSVFKNKIRIYMIEWWGKDLFKLKYSSL